MNIYLAAKCSPLTTREKQRETDGERAEEKERAGERGGRREREKHNSKTARSLALWAGLSHAGRLGLLPLPPTNQGCEGTVCQTKADKTWHVVESKIPVNNILIHTIRNLVLSF